MIPLLNTIALKVDYDEDRRELQARGAIGMMVQPALNRMNQRLAEEKPALVRDGDIVASTWLPPIPSDPFKRLVLSEGKIAIGRFVPQTVSIEVTREGRSGQAHSLPPKNDNVMETEDIFRVIDEALDLGASIITFTEGDPLLREDIVDLIRHVDPQKAVVECFTRGLDMTPEKARELKRAGLYNLLVGIYSTDPKEHDRVRGMEGAYQKAIEAIEMGLEAGLLVTMSTHIHGGQVSQIPDLYDLAASLNVHEFSIWEGIPKTPQEQITQIERETILRFYKRINKTSGGLRVFANTYFEGEMMGCMAGRRWLHVCLDGTVRACPYLKEGYGNVLDRSLKEIWKSIRKSNNFNQFKRDCPAQKLSI